MLAYSKGALHAAMTRRAMSDERRERNALRRCRGAFRLGKKTIGRRASFEFLSRGLGEERFGLDSVEEHLVSVKLVAMGVGTGWPDCVCAVWDVSVTYFPTCLLRKALSFAVQGLMMLSDGETYCFALVGRGHGQRMRLYGQCASSGPRDLPPQLHLGLQDLTMVLHAHDVLASVGLAVLCRDIRRRHGEVDVLGAKGMGRHDCTGLARLLCKESVHRGMLKA